MAASEGPAPLPAFPRSTVRLAGGLTLAYAELGPASGPVVVLLHGITNSADTWWHTANALHSLQPTWRILIPDLRGHGESRIPADRSHGVHPEAAFAMDAQAADVVDLLDALAVEHATVVGHSMGALIAQQLGVHHPDRIERIVLIATTGDARHTTILRDWLVTDVINGRWGAALASRGIDWPAHAMQCTPLDADPDAVQWLDDFWCVYPITPQVNTHALAACAAHLPLHTWLGAATAIVEYDGLAGLATLSVPAFVMWGTQDPFFTRADQDALIDALTRASVRGGSFAWKQYGSRPLPDTGLQVDEIGHNLTIEIPEQVARDIAAFITSGRPLDIGCCTDAPDAPTTIITTEAPARIVTANGRERR